MKFAEILDNEHFNTFAAIIRVPMHSRTFRQQHPKLAFWTLWEGVSQVTDVVHFKTHRQEVIDRFTKLIMECTREASWRPTTPEDWHWFYQTMDSPEARTIFNMLLAWASAPDRLVTPEEVASITGTAESGWRNKAAAGAIPGAAKKGKQWLLPVSVLRSQGVNLPDLYPEEEQSEQP